LDDLPSTGSLQLTVSFDRKEKSAAQLAAANLGPLWRRPVVITPAAIVGGLLVFSVTDALQRLLHFAVPVPAKLLASFVLIGVAAFSIRRSARMRKEAERHEKHPDDYTLNDAGLEISGVDDLALMSWSSMDRVHETDRFFLFVCGSELQYLPKRALDVEQEARVRALIARHAPVAGRSLPAPPGN
jgi:hypothetical protein